MIAVGTPIAPREILVSPSSMPVWAAALRDPNPIHVDAEAARRAGLGDRVINQGPANVGYLVNAVAAAIPGCCIESLDVRFIDNVFGGETATAAGEVIGVSDDRARIECRMTLSAGGRLVLEATVTARA